MTRCGSWRTVTRASGIDLKKNDGIRRTYARRLDRVGNPTLVRCSFGRSDQQPTPIPDGIPVDSSSQSALTNGVNTYGN